MKICPACSREYANEHTHCRDDGVALVHLDTGSTERAQDLLGQIVDGRYRIEKIVGRGGMGTVYACRHVVVGKAFAMKVLRPGIERSEEILQRFIREAKAANSVQSRHICEMTDFGQLPTGAFFVVMELLDGASLTRALREKRLDRKAIKHVFIQVAETLDKAHRANIVHRDLKPDNVVLVHDDGDPFFVKLVDFGIAKMLESKASNLTETGVILGTPYYMSPEQARGDSVDHRSDIYALGVMMYRAFTGRLPFVADTAMGVLTRHLTEKPELPSRIAEMDGGLERLILRCLEKKPIDRFQTMSDVAAALRSVPDELRRSESLPPPTIDERSGGLKAAKAEAAGMPTPTKVATPHARARSQSARPPRPTQAQGTPNARQDHGAGQRNRPSSVPPPLPPGGAAQGTPASMPIPMQLPIPAGAPPPTPAGAQAPQAPAHHLSSDAHPAQLAQSEPQSLPPYSGAAGVTDPLQGEAATNRGVVSSRMASLRTRRSDARKAALWLGIGAVMVFVGAGAAFAIFTPPSDGETAGDGSQADQPADSSGWDDPNGDGRSGTDEPDLDSWAPPSADPSSAAADSSAAPAESADADSSAKPAGKPPPGGRPPAAQPERPPPEIRSPFD